MTQEEINLKKVQEDGYAIKYIKDPSESVQLVAVQQNGFAIEYIKDQTEAVQLVAVKQNIGCIKYIKTSTIVQQLLSKGIYNEEIKNFFILLENEDFSLVHLLF